MIAAAAVRPAHATYILNVTQTGADVVATGAGSLNTTALTEISNLGVNSSAAYASRGIITVGAGSDSVWSGLTGPSSFGSGGFVRDNSETGDFVGVNDGGTLYLPANYVSGAALSGTAVFSNTDFATLGFTQGTYTYSWGSGATADALTLQIDPPAAMTEPGTVALLLTPTLGLLAFRASRRSGLHLG